MLNGDFTVISLCSPNEYLFMPVALLTQDCLIFVIWY